MSRLEELLTIRRRSLPRCGVRPDDLIAALRVVEQASEVPDKRVLSCSGIHPGDLLLVTTGETMGGCMGGCEVLLERKESGWVIVEVGDWRS